MSVVWRILALCQTWKRSSESHLSLYWHIFLLQVTEAKKIQCWIQGSSWIFIWLPVVCWWLVVTNTNCIFWIIQPYFPKNRSFEHHYLPYVHTVVFSHNWILRFFLSWAMEPSCSVSAVLCEPPVICLCVCKNLPVRLLSSSFLCVIVWLLCKNPCSMRKAFSGSIFSR